MINPFENISKKNVQKLLDSLYADVLTIEKNSPVPKTIIDSNSIGIIMEGYVQIIRNNYNGNIVIIEELMENNVFGSSLSFVHSNDYEIIAKEDTKIIVMDEYLLLNYSEPNKQYYNQFIKNMFQIMGELMKEKNERIQIITKKTIRDKLLEFFVVSRKKNGSVNIYLPYNYSAFADYLGVNRSALMRELKNLKDEGFIETKGNKIKLLF